MVAQQRAAIERAGGATPSEPNHVRQHELEMRVFGLNLRNAATPVTSARTRSSARAWAVNAPVEWSSARARAASAAAGTPEWPPSPDSHNSLSGDPGTPHTGVQQANASAFALAVATRPPVLGLLLREHMESFEPQTGSSAHEL